MNLETKNINKTVTQKRLSYGLDELAELTGLSLGFIRKEARIGNLKTKKFGARRMVLHSDLELYLRGQNEDEN